MAGDLDDRVGERRWVEIALGFAYMEDFVFGKGD